MNIHQLFLASVFMLVSPLVAAQTPKTFELGEPDGDLIGLAFGEKGKALIVSWAGGRIELRNPKTAKLIASYEHEHDLDAVAVNADGKQVAFAAGSTLGRIDTKKAKFLGSVAYEGESIRGLVWIPKWRWIFTAQGGGLFHRFQGDDPAGGHDTWGTQAGDVTAMAATEELLVVGAASGKVGFLDPKNLGELDYADGHTEEITGLAFSPKEKFVYSASLDGALRVWSTKDRKELAVLEEHPGPVTSIAVDPKGKTFASGDETGAILIWDVKTNELITTLEAEDVEGIAVLTFDPKGKRLYASASQGKLYVWEASAWKSK